MQKLKVGAVSYLNTKPLIYGFEQGLMEDKVAIIEDYPSRVAKMLMDGIIDIGLVPVAIIPRMKEHYIISNYCIGSNGHVASVGLFSEVPLEEVKEVLLDYQSRTSVALAKILLGEFWHLQPIFTNAEEDFRRQIKGGTAGVVIGDRALEQRKISKYSFDFGAAWKSLTGLPFVYAAWVSNKRLDQEFAGQFDQATSMGLSHLDKVILQNQSPFYDLKKYFTQNISYEFNNEKKKGLALFLDKLATN